jgi:hypothetical protein
MISTQEIGTLIQNPDAIRQDQLGSMIELADKYPYTQLFSIILLNGLNKYHDVRFEELLSKHSFRIANRERLYYLINDHESITEQKEITTKVEDISVQEDEPATVQTEEIQDNSELNELVTEKAKSDPMEESILHHAITSNYELPELTEEEEKRLEERQEFSVEEKEEAVESDDVIEFTMDSEQSFTAWLHSDKNYEEEDDSEKQAINAVVENFSEFNPMSELFGEVERPKAEFFSPAKKAKESLDEKQLPVSETLAKIYALQGNYPRAIAAYEQLSLKFPEKKAFFANLIKDLKKQIKK